jgi:hypothetical protein
VADCAGQTGDRPGPSNLSTALFVQVTIRAFRFLRQLRPLTDTPNVRRGSNQTVLIHTWRE